jgi:alkylhydroperoxidase family enzyme
MPRISRLDRSVVPPEVGEIYDRFMKLRGNIPNMFRTVAHRPEILRNMIDHFGIFSANRAMHAKLKELLFVRVSQINRCEY